MDGEDVAQVGVRHDYVCRVCCWEAYLWRPGEADDLERPAPGLKRLDRARVFGLSSTWIFDSEITPELSSMERVSAVVH